MEGREEMDLKFGDIQETALIPLAIKASETARPNARIKDIKEKKFRLHLVARNTEIHGRGKC